MVHTRKLKNDKRIKRKSTSIFGDNSNLQWERSLRKTLTSCLENDGTQR